MKITSLEIERFGIWEHLSLPTVSKGLNIFYGPNEAGKTTLMQYIRSSLYGCANDERAPYIQMVLENYNNKDVTLLPEEDKEGSSEQDLSEKGWVGGSLGVSTEYGQYRLDRRYLRRSSSVYSKQTALEMKSGFIATGGLANWSGRFYPIPGKGIAESLIVTGPDGTRLSDYFVQTLVNNVDESTFNNVFAIGLDELQRLGSLSETDAAQMLYRLSVGVDRVSLIQVLHQIVEERNEILDNRGKPTILEGLLDRKDRITQKAQISVFHLNEYNRILTEQKQILETIRQLKEKIEKANWQNHLYEIALSIAPTWDKRRLLQADIATMGVVAAIEENALTQSESYSEAWKKTNADLKLLHHNYQENQNKIKAIQLNRGYLDMAPRIEWLHDELSHLTRIETDLSVLRKEKSDLDSQLEQEELRLRSAKSGKVYLTQNVLDTLQEKKSDPNSGIVEINPSEGDKSSLPVLSDNDLREVEDYRVPAKAIHRAHLRFIKTKEQYSQVQRSLSEVSEQLESGLTSHGQRNLTEAMENTNDLVTSLRRRIELAKRLNEMAQARKELERQNVWLISNQSLPLGPLVAVGAGIVIGGLMVGFAFLNRELAIGLLGFLIAIVCFAIKSSAERRNYINLQENQHQLGGLLKQLEQVKEEAQVIDTKYPAPGQALDVRLQKAQTELNFFEKMVPLDNQWKEINRHFQALENRKTKVVANLKGARKRWRSWLKIAGLPLALKPSQIREMLERVDIVEDIKNRIDVIQKEIEFLQRERTGVTEHLEPILAVTHFHSDEELGTTQIIECLAEALKQEQAKVVKRNELQKTSEDYLKERRKYLRTQSHQHKEHRDFLSLFGAHNPQELIDMRTRFLEYTRKMADLAALNRELSAGIGQFCEEKTISELLDDDTVRPNLVEMKEKVQARLEVLNTENSEKTELSGRLGEQLTTLAEKREAVRYQFDRSAIDLRINEMASLWQSRSIACRMMEDIRKAYERERQPETLREASLYLKKLTSGQYVKIWTPLGDNILYVDTAAGKTMNVADLSRGTREQLFIAIRLALAVTFEKHGVQLPLVMDDVLVNFDNQRARAAAGLLYSFAKAGRQIFLFTCHEHICRIFLALNTPVYILPNQSEKNKKFRVMIPSTTEKPGEKKGISEVIQTKSDTDTISVKTDNILPDTKFVIETPKDFPIIPDRIIPASRITRITGFKGNVLFSTNRNHPVLHYYFNKSGKYNITPNPNTGDNVLAPDYVAGTEKTLFQNFQENITSNNTSSNNITSNNAPKTFPVYGDRPQSDTISVSNPIAIQTEPKIHSSPDTSGDESQKSNFSFALNDDMVLLTELPEEIDDDEQEEEEIVDVPGLDVEESLAQDYQEEDIDDNNGNEEDIDDNNENEEDTKDTDI